MQTRVVSMRYDVVRGAYDGRVDVERDGRTFRYPCRVEAPESAPRDWVEQALARHALRMSDTDRPQPAPPARRPGLLHLISDALARATHPRRLPSGVPVRAAEPPRPRARLH